MSVNYNSTEILSDTRKERCEQNENLNKEREIIKKKTHTEILELKNK